MTQNLLNQKYYTKMQNNGIIHCLGNKAAIDQGFLDEKNERSEKA